MFVLTKDPTTTIKVILLSVVVLCWLCCQLTCLCLPSLPSTHCPHHHQAAAASALNVITAALQQVILQINKHDG